MMLKEDTDTQNKLGFYDESGHDRFSQSSDTIEDDPIQGFYIGLGTEGSMEYAAEIGLLV